MMTLPQAFDLALQHHQAGQLTEAEALYRQILAVQPNHADAWHLLGVIAHQAGRPEQAIEIIQRAIALNPSLAIAHGNLGEAQRALGRHDEAIASYRRAIQLQPDYPDAHSNLGIVLRVRGQREEAIAACRRATELKPDLPEAHNNLGNALRDLGRLDEARSAYESALQLRPDFAEAHNNLGIAFREQGRVDEAIAACRQALQLKPDFAEAWNDTGNALKDSGRLDEAVAAYQHAIQLRPEFVEAHSNLGRALGDQGEREEALASCRRALALKPDRPETLSGLGVALDELGELDDAVALYRRALALDAAHANTWNNLGVTLEKQGQISDAIAAFRRALEIRPEHLFAHGNLIYGLQFDPYADAPAIAEAQKRWSRQLVETVKPYWRPHANVRDPDRPLRVGYVSADFCAHVVGRNLLPLFRRHDRTCYQILCYSGAVRSDAVTEFFQQHSDHWRETVGVSDQRLAEMIRQDGVDILVDLSQHTSGNRLRLFARRPAPVQVSFAGYPASAGLETIPYRISDRYLEWEMRSAERVFLFDSFWCYEPGKEAVEINGLPAQENGWVTFGSLVNFCKTNEWLLKLWARILSQVKNSRLVLLAAPGSHRQRTAECLAQAGVEAHRVEFVERRSQRDYLLGYHRVDIVLDSFPYNGHTTSLDALWMGVPVVSLASEQSVSRAGLSQLSNLNLSELVAHSEDEFVKIATGLAGDLSRLAELRRTLRPRMGASVLMDGPRFTRHIETAYRAMWQHWCMEESDR